MTWHAERFQAKEGRVRFDCIVCGRAMWFPPCKVGKYKTCGGDCAEQVRRAPVHARTRPCETCGATFTPRQVQVTNGGGRYCSKKCSIEGTQLGDIGNRPENRAKVSATLRRLHEMGVLKKLRGADHPQWTGGKAAWQKKNAAKLAAQARAKRLANPDRHREYVAKRRGIGRLPRGTIRRIGTAQKWKCAVCRTGIRDKYHIDHIQPLARGGLHEPNNIQLLCPPCNLTKNAKDPIAFMQSRGFLL